MPAKRIGSGTTPAALSSIDRAVCRRSAHLVSYWRGTEFFVENYAMAACVAAPPIANDVLDFFDDWRPVDALLALRPKETHDALRSLIAQMIERSLLQRADEEPSERERAMGLWRAWNPAAGFFHAASRDVRFLDMDTQVRRLRTRSRTEPMPDPVKRYRAARIVRLPASTSSGEFRRVLLARRTWRRFAAAPVEPASFGTLLDLTMGIQRWAHAAGEGKVALKTSPSGGARHAIEAYTLALRVQGVPAGLYHYAADAHVLELLAPINPRVGRRLIARYLPNQPWYTHAAAVVFFTAVFPRELWRYAYARAYRAVLIEAGHLCQTFCLTATWLGLAPFCTMALADSRIEKDLEIDGITESVLYAAGVGTRPVDAAAPPPAKAGEPSMLDRGEVQRFPGRIVRRGR